MVALPPVAAAPSPISAAPSKAYLTWLRGQLDALPAECRESFAPMFQKSILRRARLEERDGLLARMAVGLPGSISAIAESVRSDLSRYASSGWKYEKDRAAPADDRHGYAHRVLKLNGGRVPEARTIRQIITLAKNSRGNGQCFGSPEAE